jgi:hypothetical protein
VLFEEHDHRCAQELLLAPEIVVHETVIDTRATGDLPHGRAVWTDVDEQVTRRSEQTLFAQSTPHQAWPASE